MPRIKKKKLECALATQPYFVSNQMGGWLDDIAESTGISSGVQSVIDQGREAIVDTGYVSEQQIEKYSDKAEGMVEKQYTELQEQGTDLLMDQASKYVSQSDVQDKAAGGAFDATVAKARATYMDMIRTSREGGVRGLYQKYPMPFYVVAGITGLVLTKFLLGGAIKEVFISKKYTAKQNPRRGRKKRKSRK